MNAYEALYIITPELEEEATKACIQKYSDITAANGGEVAKIDEWAKPVWLIRSIQNRRLLCADDVPKRAGVPQRARA